MGIQRLGRIKGTEPLPPFLGRVRFPEELVNVSIHHIARHHEIDAGHIQHGGIVGVRVADFNGTKLVAFHVETVRVHRIGQYQGRWDLVSREQFEPGGLQSRRVGLVLHVCDGAGSRDGAHIRPVFLDHRYAEPMVTVAVRNVDIPEVFS